MIDALLARVDFDATAVLVIVTITWGITWVDRGEYRKRGKGKGTRHSEHGFLHRVYALLPILLGLAYFALFGQERELAAIALSGLVNGSVASWGYKTAKSLARRAYSRKEVE